jgi:hypothetical protein
MREHAVPRSRKSSITCPVAALEAWLQESQKSSDPAYELNEESPVFRAIATRISSGMTPISSALSCANVVFSP